MNSPGQISVAMCTYNGEKFLGEQLESIAAQTLIPSELVVCDDGSADSTPDIVAAFAKTAAFSVRFFRNPQNLGSTKNFEQAIGLCRGEFIALADQDDWWRPDKLELSMKALRGSNAGAVFSDGLLMDDQSKPTGETLWAAVRFGNQREISRFPERNSAIATLLRGNVVTGATLLFRSSTRELLLPFPPEWVHDGWLAWMLVLHSRMIALPKPLIHYRLHGSQQVSIPARSIVARLRRARETRMHDYRAIETQFQVLLEYAESHPETCSPELHRRIAEKRQHAAFRSNLRGSRWRRGTQIAGQLRAYRLYSQGWQSMLRDTLF